MSSRSKDAANILNSLFCITVDNSGSRLLPGEEQQQLYSYNDVKNMVQELGGRVSSLVHKKVDYVIASSTAVENATQRIRKANKFDIPVLKIEYIQYCYAHKTVPEDIAPYLYDNIDAAVIEHQRASISKVPISTEKMKKKRKAGDMVDSEYAPYIPPVLAAAGVTYECGCICHDRGESSCSWCEASHIAPIDGKEAIGVDNSSEIGAHGVGEEREVKVKKGMKGSSKEKNKRNKTMK